MRGDLGLLSRRAMFAAVAFGLSSTACFYPADRGRALEARVDKLSNQSVDLDEQMKAAQAALAQKTSEVTRALENLDKASRRSDADTGVQLQKTLEDLSVLRGQVESYLHRIAE